MIGLHLEKIFFHNIIKNPDYLSVVNYKFFDDVTFKKLVPVVKEFSDKYSEAPSLSQIKELVKIKNLGEEIKDSVLESAWDMDLKEYEEDWLRENTEAFLQYKNLENSAVDLINYLKTTKVDTSNIVEYVENAKALIIHKNNLDFNFSEGLDFDNPESHKQLTHLTFSSGYPFIDIVLGGGFSAGTLTVLLGAPKVGKCHLNSDIYIRNKKTQKIEKIKIEDFYVKIKSSQK